MVNVSLTGVLEEGFEPLEDLETMEEGADVIVPLQLLEEQFDILNKKAGRLAVRVSGETAYTTLFKFHERLSLITIHFPVFSDGRGFSLAVRLRKDLGFKGEIRATGHTLPDQAHYLMRAGFDSVSAAEDRLEAFEKAKSRYSSFYQSSINGDVSMARLRHQRSRAEEAA